MAYSLYQTFNDLVVSKEDYREAEVFVQSYLNSLYPTLDLREGSPLRDIVLRPCASLVSLVVKGVDKHFRDNTIAGVTNETPADVVDAIMSNFFIERNIGSSAQVVSQLRFSASIPTNSVTIPNTTTFSVDNVNKYSPVETTTLSLSDGTLLLYSDNAGAQYYYGYVTLSAADSGASSNLEVGQEFLFFTVFNPFFLGATVSSIISAGADSETNLEFVERAETAISTRNLINIPSIFAQINSNFPAVNYLKVSGYGDYEQFRDYTLLSISTSEEPIPVHLGGYVDVYCKTTLLEKVVRVKFDENGEFIFSPSDPIVTFTVPGTTRAQFYIDGSAVETEDPSIEIDSMLDLVVQDLQYFDFEDFPYPNQTGFSTKQRVKISSNSTPFSEGETIDLKMLYWSDLAPVQQFLENDSNRVVCANYLSRGFNVVEISPTLGVVGGAPVEGSDEYIALQISVTKSLSRYIEDLNPGAPFVFSDAISYLSTDITEYDFNNNILISSKVYASQLGVTHYAVSPSTGVIDSSVVANSSGHDESGSIRIAQTYIFYVRQEGVTLT